MQVLQVLRGAPAHMHAEDLGGSLANGRGVRVMIGGDSLDCEPLISSLALYAFERVHALGSWHQTGSGSNEEAHIKHRLQ